ncbi:MAG: hypothetical protein ACI8RZ_006347 [Myxococcota bacterium]|jgi:hypothetical protein
MKRSEITDHLRRLRPLLTSSDPAQVKQGVALIEALEQPALIDALLSTVYKNSGGHSRNGPDTELRSYTYTSLDRTQLLHLLARGAGPRTTALREMITALRVQGDALNEVAGLTALSELIVVGALPADAGVQLADLPALRTLRLERCTLSTLSFLPPTLTHLTLHHCHHATLDLPDDMQLAALAISTEIPALTGSLGGCRSLSLNLGRAVTTIGALRNGERLERLFMDGSGAALALGGLETLLTAAPLRRLRIFGGLSSALCELLPRLHALEHLDARLINLTDLQMLSPQAPLESLDLRKTGLTTLDGLGSRPALKVIHLDHTASLTDVSALSGAPNLRLVTLHKTSITPDQLPASVRWAGTWLASPDIEILSARPLPPTSAR